MSENIAPPINLGFIESDCDSSTHYCGRCGRKHDFHSLPTPLSPCCSIVCYPLSGGPVWCGSIGASIG
jgi:hypothetical protein